MGSALPQAAISLFAAAPPLLVHRANAESNLRVPGGGVAAKTICVLTGKAEPAEPYRTGERQSRAHRSRSLSNNQPVDQ